jgi:hypothetical protein
METTTTTMPALAPMCAAVRTRVLAATATRPHRIVAEILGETGDVIRRIETAWDYEIDGDTPQAQRLAWRLIGKPAGRFQAGEWTYWFVSPQE